MNERELRVNSRRYVDFHTHILPGVDDGSRSTKQSIQMIRALTQDNVGCIALTPHFYPEVDTPEKFIERRSRAYGELCEALADESDISDVELIAGAEIGYFDGLANMAEYPEMKLGDSACMLIEMPPDIWSSYMVDDLIELNSRSDCRVVIAHVERYLFMQKRGVIYELLENGIVMQSNAEFFINRRTSGQALKLFKKGFIHLLGSDCHNLVNRVPNIGAACDVIKKRLGEEAIDFIMEGARELLGIDAY